MNVYDKYEHVKLTFSTFDMFFLPLLGFSVCCIFELLKVVNRVCKYWLLTLSAAVLVSIFQPSTGMVLLASLKERDFSWIASFGSNPIT
jgi:hypothetical protein